MKKKGNEYDVKFYGVAKVRADSFEAAKTKLERSDKIESIRPVRTESDLYWMSKSVFINVGAIMTGFVLIIVMGSWVQVVKLVQTLPNGLDTLGILAAFILLGVCLRFPRTIGDWFDVGRKFR